MAASATTRLLPSPPVLWQAPFQEVVNGQAGRDLSGPWRLLLLGDGSPTRHLELLTGLPLMIFQGLLPGSRQQIQNSITQRSAQALEDGGMQQERLDIFRLPSQDFSIR